jgi:hypothetical protein
MRSKLVIGADCGALRMVFCTFGAFDNNFVDLRETGAA